MGKEDDGSLSAFLDMVAGKIQKKKLKVGKTQKAVKAFKEWKGDFVRTNDEEMMILVTEQLCKLR